jgi:hypothetical protein
MRIGKGFVANVCAEHFSWNESRSGNGIAVYLSSLRKRATAERRENIAPTTGMHAAVYSFIWTTACSVTSRHPCEAETTRSKYNPRPWSINPADPCLVKGHEMQPAMSEYRRPQEAGLDNPQQIHRKCGAEIIRKVSVTTSLVEQCARSLCAEYFECKAPSGQLLFRL